MINTKNDSDQQDSSLHTGSSRRRFLSVAGALAISSGFTANTSATASINSPNFPDEFSGDDWSDPIPTGENSRDDSIEWSGKKTQNEKLKQQVVQEEEEYEQEPLWNLYAWKINQTDEPSNQSDRDESDNRLSDILDGFSVSVPLGPTVVSADLGEISEVATESEEYVSQVATDVFADQIESDYSVEGEVERCNGFREPGYVWCSGEEDSYSNSPADEITKYSFEMDYELGDGWLDPSVTYRALFVVQTYDTDKESNLNKTFIATGAVFPIEMTDVSVLDDYDFVDTSREFMKNIN